jgi:hypothetical protein
VIWVILSENFPVLRLSFWGELQRNEIDWGVGNTLMAWGMHGRACPEPLTLDEERVCKEPSPWSSPTGRGSGGSEEPERALSLEVCTEPSPWMKREYAKSPHLGPLPRGEEGWGNEPRWRDHRVGGITHTRDRRPPLRGRRSSLTPIRMARGSDGEIGIQMSLLTELGIYFNLSAIYKIGVGMTHWCASPLPPNRTGGSPASGSPVRRPSSGLAVSIAVLDAVCAGPL